jgi:hypothetical protein
MGIVYREHPGSLAKEAWEAYKTSLGKGGWQLLNNEALKARSFLIFFLICT